ncbi:o-succinylbenzoate synthase [Indiicoccus explosivorum]|uniref:o-succinylbenzoate synthase n=1 Tax=Indiicoccus explosivorum TaxID=1917864 RepID=UPI000B44D0A0|nr:o-succinylbenzoate synthase [Indiicoccus explosivorum]
MDLTLDDFRIQDVSRPLKTSFRTHLQEVKVRESLIVSVASGEQTGFGECTAFSTPWYTEETVSSCRFVLNEVLVPILNGKTFSHPAEVSRKMASVKGNRMAKAAVETAVWDLFAKKSGVPLWKYVGGVQAQVPAGTVVAAGEGELHERVGQASSEGYKRVKLKICTASDPVELARIRSEFPEMLFFADANGAFSADTYEELKRFDQCGFTLIEQPFGEEEWALHAKSSAEFRTPICLDESLTSRHAARRMLQEGAGSAAVLKMGRLGGWQETLEVYQLFRKAGIRMWVGGMIDFGVSKAHNLALASLPGIDLPGDFSASSHYWEEDIVRPGIGVAGGQITLPDQPGIGFQVDF